MRTHGFDDSYEAPSAAELSFRSASQRELFNEHTIPESKRNVPILDEAEADLLGVQSRVPPIDLHLPRIISTPRNTPRQVQSGFIAKANVHTGAYMNVIMTGRDTTDDDLPTPPQKNRQRNSMKSHTRDRQQMAQEIMRAGFSGLLGTNEEHALEFNDAMGELVGLLNRRSDPNGNSGSHGLWSESDFPRIKMESERAKEAKAAAVASSTSKSPRNGKKGKASLFVPTQPRISLIERAIMAQKETAVERNTIQSEIHDKVERLRHDAKEYEAFDFHVQELIKQRQNSNRSRADGKEAADFTVVNKSPTSLAKLSPRSRLAAIAERRQDLEVKMAKAKERCAAVAAEKLAYHEQALLHHEQVHAAAMARRAEAAARAELVRRQSGWMMLINLASRSKQLGDLIEPQRMFRTEDKAARMLQKAFRQRQLWRRCKALACSRRALTKVVWLLRLRVRASIKKSAVKKVKDFLYAVKNQAAGVLAVRAFSYRVGVAQRLWRKHAAQEKAMVELLILQCLRAEERSIRRRWSSRQVRRVRMARPPLSM